MEIKIADNVLAKVEIGDTARLRDGRIMEVSEFAQFGRVKMVDTDGRFYFAKPIDIVEIIEKVMETVQEVTDTVEKAQTFWTYFKTTVLGNLILSFFKKKPNAG